MDGDEAMSILEDALERSDIVSPSLNEAVDTNLSLGGDQYDRWI